ncbi:flagellar assembly factor FliW [Fontibacillus phaseoli]|uniref:Flagellar assembly factor FliW n=1 Tax=Fontibacillus phaseoli TaxID=1416533 RepID=A0A369BC16_9BACL|nr:flagellar assembly protein FliW [Fontibacillus phaseoli]RCX19080.1 flagellar assembly factor FliW [Fontibacillus phaseoli]
MKRIHSEAYGLLVVEDSQIYLFESGILGIPDIRQYALLPMDGTPFFVLHAFGEEVSFILLPSHLALEDYNFRISDETISLLELKSPDDVGVMLIVNINQDKLYVNLMAPILLSPHSLKGFQYIIKDQEFPVRYPLEQKGEA